MNKYLTKRDIMELICISAAQFEWTIKKIKIKAFVDCERLYFYTIQDMINIYNFIYNRKRIIIRDSKINYKTMKL
jgi:hypothetical protein